MTWNVVFTGVAPVAADILYLCRVAQSHWPKCLPCASYNWLGIIPSLSIWSCSATWHPWQSQSSSLSYDFTRQLKHDVHISGTPGVNCLDPYASLQRFGRSFIKVGTSYSDVPDPRIQVGHVPTYEYRPTRLLHTYL